MTITTIGLDLAKNVFQVHGADAEGRPVLQRQLRRSEVRRFFANLAPCLIGMEACGGAHFWARELQTLGHEVRLMPPQYVRPYVKRNKNDSADAAAICEAMTRPTMRFVPVKSPEQQALLALHRMRELLVRQRSMLISAVRAHFAESGLVAGQGVRNVSRLVAILDEAGDPRLPDLAREALSALVANSAISRIAFMRSNTGS